MQARLTGGISWILPLDGLVLMGLSVMILARFFRGVPVLRPKLYRIASLVGFFGWVCFLFSGGSYSGPPGSLSSVIGIVVFLTAFLMPVEAGFVGWLGTTSRWRWSILLTGFLLALAVYYIAFW